MVKILNILFALFYLLVATGFNVSAHRCGKKIRFVSIDSSHEKKCPCGKNMRPGCCKDFHVYLKITGAQKASSQIILSTNSFTKTLIAVAFQESEKPFHQVGIFDITNYHAPPYKTKLPFYLAGGILRV